MQNIKMNLSKLLSFAAGKQVLNLGTMRIILSKPGTLFGVTEDDQQIALGHGTDFKISVPDAYAFSANVPFTVLDFPDTATLMSGEILTNEDKRPNMSVAEQQVTLALRKLNRTMKQQAALSARAAYDQKVAAGQAEPKEHEPITQEEKEAAQAKAQAEADAEAAAKAQEAH